MIFSLRVSASWTGGDLNIVTESSRCCLSIFLSVCPTLHRGVFLALILFSLVLLFFSSAASEETGKEGEVVEQGADE